MTTLLAWVALHRGDEVTLDMFFGSEAGGTAVYARELLDDKGTRATITLDIGIEGGPRSKVVQESVYDMTGRPIRMLQTVFRDGERAARSATFGEGGVRVVAADREETVAYPDSGTWTVASERWWIDGPPHTDEANTFWRFDLTRASWVETVAKFEGRHTVVVNGNAIVANRIVVGDSTSHVDDRGIPWRIEVGTSTVFVRRG